MPLTEKDLKAIGLLMEQTIDDKLLPLRDEMHQRFDQVAGQLDGLYKRTETLEQEHTVICEQLTRIETKLDNHDGRIQRLEKKVA
jgi:predicted  nucleic acid-binding Zn-ribbon protein